MWLVFSFSGRILGFSHVSWLEDTRVSLLPCEKGQAWVKSANKTSTSPRGSRHTQLHFPQLTAWPLLISLLTLQPFMTLPCVIIAPRWGHASLEGKRDGETDKGVMEGERQGKKKRKKKRERDERRITGLRFGAWRFKRWSLMSLIFLFSPYAPNK